MRVSLPLSLPAVLLLLACSDGAATSPSATARPSAGMRAERAGGTASVVLPPVGGFTSQVLTRGHFTDDIGAQFRIKVDGGATTVAHVSDPSDMVMARITIAPGGALPWHTHPGPALVTIAAGELTFVDSHDCEVRHYPAGSSLMDAGQGHVHTAFNAGSTEMVLYVTYLAVPTGQSPLVPTANPGC